MDANEFKAVWIEGKDLIQLAVFALAVVAALWALARVRSLIELAKELRLSQQSSFDLRVAANNMQQLKEFLPALKEAASNLGKLNDFVPTLKEQIPLLNEGLNAATKQIAEIQRRQADEAPQNPATAVEGNSGGDDDWIRIREMWGSARDKIEEIIDDIRDGRVRRKYDGITRYDYTGIINEMLTDGFLKPSSAEAALRMNKKFLSLRPRNRPIRPEDVAEIENAFVEFENGVKST